MAKDINKIFLTGRLGDEIKNTIASNGKTTIGRFSIATENPGKENPFWFNVTVFNETAEYMLKNAKKGMQVYLEGSLSTYSQTNKSTGKSFTSINIVGNVVRLVTASSSGQNEEKSEKSQIDYGGLL